MPTGLAILRPNGKNDKIVQQACDNYRRYLETLRPETLPELQKYVSAEVHFQDPFNEYALPQSILRFRQGFGRLIRGEQDRGIVLILDQRIVSRPYGSVFLDSIPECNVVTGYIRDISEVSKRWLSRKA